MEAHHGHAGPTTILFTDIEGSTKLWESQPDAMSRALKKHDALARAAVANHSGTIVKMIGDGMYAVFADPMDGVNAILELQQALADPAATEGVTIKIRCGIHMGHVEQRDNDLFGPPVNRSARIMGVAHGGQILLSQAVVDSVAPRLPSEIELKDLGGIRLKDLASPERVYQVVHPKLRRDFPALRSLESTPNNLPQQLTAFIGRELELQQGGEMLKRARLLTLLGMGGLGKTRLSLQLAADALDSFADGAWFVDLAPIQDASLVPSVLAQTLAVQEEPGRALTETLCAHLKSRTLLIVLDNCEHLIDACAGLANAILRTAPTVRMIATSREPLHIAGEQTYPILPLPIPPRRASAAELLTMDAVQLFVDRVRAHKPAFELTDREAPDEVLDLQASLVDKSLVMAEEREEGTRYRALETIRDFAREKLAARGEVAPTAARHCDHYLLIAKAGNKGLKGTQQSAVIRRLEAELDNMRVAIALALQGGVDPILAVKFQVALMTFWMFRGYVSEGRKSVDLSIANAAVQASDVAHAHGLYVGGVLRMSQSDYAGSAEMLGRCLEVRRRIDATFDIAATLSTLSLVQLHAGNPEAARESENEAIIIFREIAHCEGEAVGLLHLGQISMYEAKDDDAIDYFNRCLVLACKDEHSEIESECERMLGEIALEGGDLTAAEARFLRSYNICKDVADKRDEATSLWGWGKVDLVAGRCGAARERLCEAIRVFQSFEMHEEAIFCIEDLARLAVRCGEMADGARLYAVTEAHRKRLSLTRSARGQMRWDREIAHVVETLGKEPFEALSDEVRSWSLEESVQAAIAAGAQAGTEPSPKLPSTASLP